MKRTLVSRPYSHSLLCPHPLLLPPYFLSRAFSLPSFPSFSSGLTLVIAQRRKQDASRLSGRNDDSRFMEPKVSQPAPSARVYSPPGIILPCSAPKSRTIHRQVVQSRVLGVRRLVTHLCCTLSRTLRPTIQDRRSSYIVIFIP